MPNPGISFQHIFKSFGDKEVLHDIDLQIEAGETHVLLGLSGSGKSTLLKILMDLIPADSGDISLFGKNLSETPRQDWVMQIGYAPQDSGLFPHLNVRDNVTLIAKNCGWSRERIDQRLEEMLQLTALDPDLLRSYPRSLSGGQRQRVALIRAAFRDPKVMVFDEPLGALDPLIRADLQDDLRSIFERLKKTVLFVTHDLQEAAYFGHRLTLLKEGQILQTGKLESFIKNPSDPYVTKFISAQRGVSL